MSSDRTCRTLTAGQLIEKLRRVDPDLPVVFTSRDEPLGDYGVRSLTVCEMQRENLVVLLDHESPWTPTIDAEVIGDDAE